MTDVAHTCSTHQQPAALTCARCGAFVCASCELREADVGVVCAACARGHTQPPKWLKRRQRRETFLIICLVGSALSGWPSAVALFAAAGRKLVAGGPLEQLFTLAGVLGVSGSLLLGLVVSVVYGVSRKPHWAYGFAIVQAAVGLAGGLFEAVLDSASWALGTVLICANAGFVALMAHFTRAKSASPPAAPKWRASQLIR